MFVGVDGFRGGWVAIIIDGERFVAAHRFVEFDALMKALGDARAIGVDMPIGLRDGPRAADQAARDFLRGNASSVFNAPVRSTLQAKSYAEASAISTRVLGKGLSQQSYNLLAKIGEVDAHVRAAQLYEVHPEVSFRLMNDEGRLPHAKKTWGGLTARLSLLRAQGIVLPDRLGEADAVGIDDVVDAAAAAWSARRIAAGQARSFPVAPLRERDRGRAIAIWA